MEMRLAQKDDLPALKIMFEDIVKLMHERNIKIWNDYYPFEEFEDDIKRKELYVVVMNNEIVGAFCLLKNVEGVSSFNWSNNSVNALYLSRLGVNVNYLAQGVASFIIRKAEDIALGKGVQLLRLMVSEDNLPAISLYKHNKFVHVEGRFVEFSQSLNKSIIEIGFEKEILKG